MEKVDPSPEATPQEGRTIFRTETGSTYEVDYGLKTWTRLEPPRFEGGHPLRTGSGTFDRVSPIEVGEPVTIFAEPLNPEATFRCIQTSLVEEILSTSEHAVD